MREAWPRRGYVPAVNADRRFVFMLQQNVAAGIHRVEDAYTNWYIVEDEGALTIVDAGVPTSWSSLEEALASLGKRRTDVRALILTHAHFDHIGFAERLAASSASPSTCTRTTCP